MTVCSDILSKDLYTFQVWHKAHYFVAYFMLRNVIKKVIGGKKICLDGYKYDQES